MTKTSAEQLLCSCGHKHAVGENCTAVISGTPMLNYCPCPGCTPVPVPEKAEA